MNRRLLLGMTAALALAFSASSALAQAAAEAAMVNAHSAATTVKAGSALGSALNRVNRNLAGQVEQVSHPALGKISQAAESVPVQGAAAPAPSPLPSGDLITSISGATTSCTASSTTPPASDKPAAQSPQQNCSAATKPVTQRYKSVVTVSF